MQVLTIVLLMICNGQNPGSLTSGTSHNKCSKMPPSTSMHKCLHACDVIYYVIAVRARRMVHIFFLPYLGNRSKSDPCSYELFCLESHILSFPKVLQIPPESPCMYICMYRHSVTYVQLHSGRPNASQIFCKSEFSTQVVKCRYVSKGVQLKSSLQHTAT